jgi:cytochrome b
MPVMQRLRLYHAALAVLVVLSYLSGEWGIVHAWLGYGVAAVILVRLGLAATGAPQLGLMRFYPHFEGLKLDNVFTHPAISRTLLAAIAVCTIGATVTGVMMDRGRAIGLAESAVIAPAYADDEAETGARGEREDEGAAEELHETFANFLVLLVVVHVSYLLAFKRPLARFMLFLPGAK